MQCYAMRLQVVCPDIILRPCATLLPSELLPQSLESTPIIVSRDIRSAKSSLSDE